MRLVGFLAAVACLAWASCGIAQEGGNTRIGDWEIRSASDPMTDQVRYVAVATATDGESRLVFTCAKPGRGSTYFHFISSQYLRPRLESDDALVRFDKDAPFEVWGFYDKSTVELGQGAAQRKSFQKFISRIATAETVAVRVTTSESQPVDMSFAVSGANEALGLVARQCKEL